MKTDQGVNVTHWTPEIGKVLASKENFYRFVRAMVRKAFTDRCRRFSKPVTEQALEYFDYVADFYADRFWPMEDYPVQNLQLLMDDFNMYGAWDKEEHINRTLPGIEGFLQKVEPPEVFARLHGVYMKSLNIWDEV